MREHNLSKIALTKDCFAVAITAASNNGATIDALGYDRTEFTFNSKPSGALTTSDCKLQEGDASDASDMADVAGATFTQVTTAGGAKIALMDVKNSKRKRYLRLVHTGAGGAAAGVAAGSAKLYRGAKAPVTQDVAPKYV
jgi:hypothetical protein